MKTCFLLSKSQILSSKKKEILTALMLPLLTKVDRVTVTPSLSFCWYPRPISLLLLIFALTAAPSSSTYLAPIPKLVEELALLQPKLTPVSRAGLTFW